MWLTKYNTLINPSPGVHPVLGTSPLEQFVGKSVIFVGMGCFWGAERLFWRLDGVVNTAVGYQGGDVPNPTYEQVCTGRTGHAEVVRVVYDPQIVTTGQVLRVFWENHLPNQGMRQGNDRGSQYRSLIFTTDPEQLTLAQQGKDVIARQLAQSGQPPVTTEIFPPEQLKPFYLAEEYHQAYLNKNPGGYCMHGANGLSCSL